MNIVEFLEARIAEDEAVANNATGAQWVVVPGMNASLVNIDATHVRDEKWKFGRFGHIATTSHDAAYAEHIARNNPARALAECAAKRVIIAGYKAEQWQVSTALPPSEFEYWSDGGSYFNVHHLGRYIKTITWDQYVEEVGAVKMPPADALRALAAIYADHADYDSEWAL